MLAPALPWLQSEPQIHPPLRSDAVICHSPTGPCPASCGEPAVSIQRSAAAALTLCDRKREGERQRDKGTPVFSRVVRTRCRVEQTPLPSSLVRIFRDAERDPARLRHRQLAIELGAETSAICERCLAVDDVPVVDELRPRKSRRPIARPVIRRRWPAVTAIVSPTPWPSACNSRKTPLVMYDLPLANASSQRRALGLPSRGT
jgi:hypothetical protein